MPFRLTNALGTFQAYINKALGKLLNDFCIVYLDDILVYSQNPKDYKDYVQQVLKRLKQYKLYTNLKKCIFLAKEVEFLGFIISTYKVFVDLAQIATIVKQPKLETFI